MVMKVYWYMWNFLDMEESSIVFYSKETGYLEYFDTGFFSQHESKEELFADNKCGEILLYLGRL